MPAIHDEQPRRVEAAVVEEDAAGQREAVGEIRERLEDGVVPEQKLRQQRYVADQLDISGRQTFHQEVLRKPRDADGGAKQRREQNAEAGDHSVLIRSTQKARPKVEDYEEYSISVWLMSKPATTFQKPKPDAIFA